MKNVFLILFLQLVTCLTFSQNPPNISKVSSDTAKCRIWSEYCKEICDKGSYAQLIPASNKGLLIAQNNYYYKAFFYFYKGLGYEFGSRDDKAAIALYEQSLAIAKKNNYMTRVGLATRRLNFLYYLHKERTKQTQLLDYVSSVVDTTRNWEVKADFLVCISNNHLYNERFEQFIDYALKAIEVYSTKLKKSTQNDRNISFLYRNIVHAFMSTNMYDKTLEYCQIAEKYCPVNEELSLLYLYKNYVKIYSHFGNVVNEKKYIQKINNLKINSFDKETCLGEAYISLSDNYFRLRQFSDAIIYVEKAVNCGVSSKNEEVLLEANTKKGAILFEMKEYREVIKLLSSQEEVAKHYTKDIFAELTKTLSDSYERVGDWRNALKYQKIYSITRDSILNEASIKNFENAEARFQNKVKQQKINALVAQNTINELKAKQTKSQLLILLLCVIIALLLVASLVVQNVNRKKTNEKLQQLNTDLDEANRIKARFFSILNHDLRSPIASIIGLIRQKNENPDIFDSQTLQRLENSTLTQSENLLESMEDMLLWGKGQMSNFESQITPVPIAELFEYLKKYFSKYEDIIHFEMDSKLILNTDADFLKAITRNLTDNAVKASAPTNEPYVKWKAWINTENAVCLSITNNSKELQSSRLKALFDEKETIGIKHGLGLHVIRDLAKASHCSIEVEVLNGNETTVHLVYV